MWKDTVMSIINDIISWIDTVIFGNKTKTSKAQEEDAPAVPIYEKKAKSTSGRAKKETSPGEGRTKKPNPKKPAGTKKSSKSIKKKTTSNS